MSNLMNFHAIFPLYAYILHINEDRTYQAVRIVVACSLCRTRVTWFYLFVNSNFVAIPVGQEKIVRAFTEIMKNMARMKTCIRPAMCKPYGKQSESLQKSKNCTCSD